MSGKQSDDGQSEELLVRFGSLYLTTAALTEALGIAFRQLRANAPEQVEPTLVDAEKQARRIVDNSTLDGLPETIQLLSVEEARGLTRGIFAKIRNEAHD
jgi:hypothetical protein